MKGEETAIIEQVTLIGGKDAKQFQHANIRMRFNRNPVIGRLGCVFYTQAIAIMCIQ